ncbi:RNA pyrophosphohydrolase [Sneathiella aquimaris]|uniref:RNA pyrophosphohydrolase n=1 Tax=Sneathiella aquimaris TaxID=2599305 RepID=UPI00146B73A1|nr:RNA pyrophosphohydrolase [Sneathiella aquimaris]
MTEARDLPYRPCAGIMVLNAKNEVFVGKRIDMPSDYWQMPQGGIDHGESPRDAAIREMLEEIGTDNADLIAETEDWLTYDLPNHLIGNIWKGKYRGQKQKWFLFRFKGKDSEINIATEHPEFSEWKWSAPENLVSEIVPFKKEIYKKIVERFSSHFD